MAYQMQFLCGDRWLRCASNPNGKNGFSTCGEAALEIACRLRMGDSDFDFRIRQVPDGDLIDELVDTVCAKVDSCG